VNVAACGNSRRNLMSWFKHKPRLKNPPKLHPHHSSPISEQVLKEAKKRVSGQESSSGNKKNKEK
jgi:hypothetical protein